MKPLSPDDPELLQELLELEEEGEVSASSKSKPSWSPLHWFAAKYDANPVSAQAHVVRGLDPSVQNDVGDTPLHIAVWREDAAKVDFLLALEARRDVANAKGNFPLHQALRKKNMLLAAKLLDGVNLAEPDAKGISAIGHWVTEVCPDRTGLFEPGSPGDQVWTALKNADRAAWAGWQGKLCPVFLADLRRHRLEDLDDGLPEATLKAARPRL